VSEPMGKTGNTVVAEKGGFVFLSIRAVKLPSDLIPKLIHSLQNPVLPASDEDSHLIEHQLFDFPMPSPQIKDLQKGRNGIRVLLLKLCQA